jgi:O-Antigen ligase
MRAAAQALTPGSAASLAGILGAIALLEWAVLRDQHIHAAVAILFCAIVVSLWHRTLFAWPTLIGATILVILWIPIRRFELPGALPFSLEPYRVLVFVVAVAWIGSLFVDRTVKVRGTPIDGPIIAVLVVAALSIAVNSAKLVDAAVNSSVWKSMLFLLSYPILFYVIVNVTKTYEAVERLTKILVGGGAVVAFFALVEARTQWNFFDHFGAKLPGLTFLGPEGGDFQREGHHRVLASAEHPIALSAMLVMLVPLAIALGQSTKRRRWWLAAGLMGVASLAALSRTGVMMFLVIGIVFAVLRPGSVKQVLPFIPLGLVLVHFALPGTLGTFKELFFPPGGVVAEQSQGRVGSSRGASFHAGVPIVKRHPFLGQGYGTRLRGQDSGGQNSFITDDQWLGTAMDTGLIGLLAWLWLFVRSVRCIGREAKRDRGQRGLLLTGLAAGIAAFAVGMIYYDAFSFIQVTFVLFLFLALGCATIAEKPEAEPALPG